MSDVLITGIEGFTGSYLSRLLRARGYDVAGTTHREPRTPDEVQCDLTDLSSVRAAINRTRPEHVVHMAAVSYVAHEDIEAFYQVNVLGTLNLLRAIHDSGRVVKKILLASSANVYGNAEVEPIDETVRPAPINDYAVSKLAMEYVAGLWFEKLPIVVVRPFNYTGIGQGENFLLPKIVMHFRERRPVLELGNLDVARDFSDVRVVVDCYARLLESSASGVIANICSERAYSLREVLAVTAAIADYSPEVRVNSALVRAKDVHRLVGSRRLLETIIGPIQDIPLHETLRWMLEGGA